MYYVNNYDQNYPERECLEEALALSQEIGGEVLECPPHEEIPAPSGCSRRDGAFPACSWEQGGACPYGRQGQHEMCRS